ncbi:MAG: hypothetical protein ABJC24_09420 [Chloroflexota bacterium]
MRSILALLGGMAISMTGLVVVLDTTWELAGVALIVAGVAAAARGMSVEPRDRLPDASDDSSADRSTARSSMVGWPRGLGSRLARRGSARRRSD